MENGFNDFMLGFLYWTISQCSVFCWKLILGISFCFVFLWRGWCRGFFSFFFSVILMWNSQRAADQKYWLADVCRTALPPPTRSSSVFSGEDGASLLQAMQQEGPRWSPPADWPLPCPHLVHAIFYQPKNAWGAGGSIQGDAFESVCAVLSPCPAWCILWLLQPQKIMFSPIFYFLRPLGFHWEDVISRKSGLLLAMCC